jgi:hypothetical protein
MTYDVEHVGPIGEHIERIVTQLGEVDPDLKVVLVLSGSPATGLAVNLWTDFEGDGAEMQAWNLIIHAADQVVNRDG